MAKSRKIKPLEEIAKPAGEPVSAVAAEPDGPIQEASVIDAVSPVELGESPVLENSGEMEDESAVVIDSDLSSLLNTPLGLRGAIETLLFISPEPLTTRRIGNVLDLRDSRLVLATVKQLQAEYDNERRGLAIVETADGFQMSTREVYGDLVLRLKGRRRRPPLSATALETLSIIAYRQPVIRAEIEAIRGVESSGAIRNLIDMGLVEMTGRKDVLGRPPMYGTTAQFLQSFSLKDLASLPPIAELKRQTIESAKAAEASEQEAFAARREEEAQHRLEVSQSIRRKAEEAASQGKPEESQHDPSQHEESSMEDLETIAESSLAEAGAERFDDKEEDASFAGPGPEDEEDEDEDNEDEDGDDYDDDDDDDDDDNEDDEDEDEDEDDEDEDDEEDDDEEDE